MSIEQSNAFESSSDDSSTTSSSSSGSGSSSKSKSKSNSSGVSQNGNTVAVNEELKHEWRISMQPHIEEVAKSTTSKLLKQDKYMEILNIKMGKPKTLTRIQ